MKTQYIRKRAKQKACDLPKSQAFYKNSSQANQQGTREGISDIQCPAVHERFVCSERTLLQNLKQHKNNKSNVRSEQTKCTRTVRTQDMEIPSLVPVRPQNIFPKTQETLLTYML
jgi:hypothetical protein